MLEQQEAGGRVFHVLGDRGRRAMIERLSRGPASVSELAEPFTMTSATVSQDLEVLEGRGIITTTKIGRVRTCRLASRGLPTAERWIAQRRAQWERRLDRLGDFLDEEAATPAPARRRKRNDR